VFSIQSLLLVALGFLSAGLLTLILAPAFWSRAVRMTDKRLRERLPISEDEVRADKDRIRAEAAMRIHKLEMRLEQADLFRARHRIELSRRDDSIATLERSVVSLTSNLDEHLNARRVLEQTVGDRLPKVEQRLSEAKGLLFNRDREIADLTQSTKRQQVALEEATSINAQQNSEMKRLSSALTTRGARNGQGVADPKFESELALRTEIEALRAKTGEQASLINRLQSQMNNGLMSVASLSELVASAQKGTPVNRSLNGNLSGVGPIEDTRNQPGLATLVHAQAAASLQAPQQALLSAHDGNDNRVAELTSDLRAAQIKSDDQASEIIRLSAELRTYQAETTADPNAAKDSRIALKARLGAVEAVGAAQVESIKKLRTELAAANERLALQASHFMDEMRRLGAGTLPTSAQQRRPVTNGARPSLAERVSNGRPNVVAEASDDGAQSRPSEGDAALVEQNAQATPDDVRRPRLLDRISSLNKS
jgi:hypothetical protein